MERQLQTRPSKSRLRGEPVAGEGACHGRVVKRVVAGERYWWWADGPVLHSQRPARTSPSQSGHPTTEPTWSSGPPPDDRSVSQLSATASPSRRGHEYPSAAAAYRPKNQGRVVPLIERWIPRWVTQYGRALSTVGSVPIRRRALPPVSPPNPVEGRDSGRLRVPCRRQCPTLLPERAAYSAPIHAVPSVHCPWGRGHTRCRPSLSTSLATV